MEQAEGLDTSGGQVALRRCAAEGAFYAYRRRAETIDRAVCVGFAQVRRQDRCDELREGAGVLR